MGEGLIVRRGGVTGAEIEGSHMSQGIVSLTGTHTNNESFTNVLKIAHGLGVVPSYYNLNVVGNIVGYAAANYALSNYNFQSLVPNMINYMVYDQDGEFSYKGYHGNLEFQYIRARVDENYIYIDVKSEWHSGGNWKSYGCLPTGTLHWVAVA